MGFLTRCKRPFLFAFLLQFCNMLFSFFLKTFLILFEKQHLRLPWFTRMSECKEYVQDCKGPNTRSWSVLDPKYLGGVLMGIVRAEGEGTTEKGHPSVAQWNYALPGADFHLTVNDETVEQADGDFSYVTPGDDHSLVSDAGKLTYYIWYERRVYTEQ